MAVTSTVGGVTSGYWATGKREHGHPAGQHEDDRQHGGEDRTVDEEVGDHGSGWLVVNDCVSCSDCTVCGRNGGSVWSASAAKTPQRRRRSARAQIGFDQSEPRQREADARPQQRADQRGADPLRGARP